MVLPLPGAAGASKAVLKSRFISFWSELSSRSGSQRTMVTALPPFTIWDWWFGGKYRISVGVYQFFFSRLGSHIPARHPPADNQPITAGSPGRHSVVPDRRH